MPTYGWWETCRTEKREKNEYGCGQTDCNCLAMSQGIVRIFSGWVLLSFVKQADCWLSTVDERLFAYNIHFAMKIPAATELGSHARYINNRMVLWHLTWLISNSFSATLMSLLSSSG